MAEMSWRGDWLAIDPPPRRIDARMLGASLLAGAGAAAWFVLANTFDVVREFGGSLGALGGAMPYASAFPTLVAWLLVLTAVLILVPGVPSGSRRGLQLGVFALVTAAFLEVISALCSLWESGLTNGQVVLSASTIETCFNLLRASSILAIAALLLFAVGSLMLQPPRTGRAALHTGGRPSAWRAPCRMVALALVVGVVQQCYLLFTLFAPTPPPYQVQTLLSGLPSACMWFGLAAAMILVSQALSEKARRFATCTRLGEFGFSLLAASSLLQILYYEITRTQPLSSVADAAAKAASASTCLAYLMLTAGLLGAAALLLSPTASTRDALRALLTDRRVRAVAVSR